MAPGTEFAHDFCVGIGPLQLGVVLVIIKFQKMCGYIDYKQVQVSQE